MFIENVKKSSLNLVSNQGTSDLEKKNIQNYVLLNLH